MNKRKLNEHTKEQKEIINNMSMSEVVSKLTGITPKKISSSGNYVLVCPIHGKTGKGYNCSIKGDKTISCWSQECLRGDGVFSFLEKYLVEREGLTDFIDRFKRIDGLLGTSLYIPLAKQENKKEKKKENLFTKEFWVNKYCLEEEVEKELMFELLSEKTSILNAGTGTGKTYFLAHFADFLTKNKLVDKVFFLTPRRSLVEEIAEKYKDLNFVSFMGNDDFLPEASNIVATTHKCHRINSSIEMPEIFISDEKDFHFITEDISYVVIIDECHLLHTSRQIVGNIDEINRLIKNSSYTIFTSANTDHFYKACKETYDIKNYVSVKRKQRMYNLEKLDIIRVEGKEQDLVEYTKEIILKTPLRKTLIINNNIVQNNKLSDDFKKVGINCESINSKNKEDNPAYDEIIKNSLLKNEITICTSIIDTGININENFVRTIIIAPKSQFDDISIIQGFARVRTTIGNTGILVTSGNKRIRNSLYDFEKLKEVNKEEVERLALTFNEHMFDFYTTESYEEYKTVWNICRENELYAKRKDILKVDGGKLNSNPLLKIDDIMLYEKTRKEILSLNHCNDNFILESLKDINAKETKLKTDIFIAKKENQNQEKNKRIIFEVISKIKDSDIALESLVSSCKKNMKTKDIVVLKDIMELDTKLASDIKKTIKNLINYKTLEKIELDEIELARDILSSFVHEEEAEVESGIRKIKWRLYNNVYKINKKYFKDEFKGNGDIIYALIREIFDNAYRRKRKITDVEYNILLEEYLKTKGYKVTSEGIGKNKGDGTFKKISIKIFEKNLKDIKEKVNDIYEIKDDEIISLKI